MSLINDRAERGLAMLTNMANAIASKTPAEQQAMLDYWRQQPEMRSCMDAVITMAQKYRRQL